MQSTSLIVNGNAVSVTADADTPLLDVLRNHLGLDGHEIRLRPGAMRLLHGAGRRPPGEILRQAAVDNGGQGRSLTIEGLGTPERPHPLQQAFLDEQAGQCGYCLAGILISAKALLDHNPSPSRAEIAAALDDNICRCGSHVRILRAVERAARLLREGAAR